MRKLHDVLRQAGIENDIREGLKKLVPERHDRVWQELSEWRFTVNYRATGRTGLCSYKKKAVEITHVLMAPEHAETMRQTLKHETAHAVDKIIHGVSSRHGRPWQTIMRAFGARPDRCNTDSDVSKVMIEKRKAKAKLIYACQHCEFEFPAMRRKKRPADAYFHNPCRHTPTRGTLYIKQDTSGRIHPNPSKQTT